MIVDVVLQILHKLVIRHTGFRECCRLVVLIVPVKPVGVSTRQDDANIGHNVGSGVDVVTVNICGQFIVGSGSPLHEGAQGVSTGVKRRASCQVSRGLYIFVLDVAVERDQSGDDRFLRNASGELHQLKVGWLRADRSHGFPCRGFLGRWVSSWDLRSDVLEDAGRRHQGG